MVAHDQTIKEKPSRREPSPRASRRHQSSESAAATRQTFIRKYYKVSDADVESIYSETSRFLRSALFLKWKGFRTLGRAFPSFAGAASELKKYIDTRSMNEALSKQINYAIVMMPMKFKMARLRARLSG